MRKISYLFLLISLYLSVLAYAEISENQWNGLEQSDRVQIIKDELSDVVDLEDQIDQLRTVALRKRQVKNLEKQGLYDQIKELFKEDESTLKSSLVEKDLSKTILLLEDLKLAYKSTSAVNDEFLFYGALIDFQKKDYSRAQTKLENLINKYPASSKYKSANYTLQNIYIKSGQNEKFLKSYEEYVWDKSSSQDYWYGQTLYNENKYIDAVNVFETLTEDQTFGFRSQFMIALISSFTEPLEAGLESFLLLMQAYPVNTPYYEYIPLSIARIQAQRGDIESATKYYSQYNSIVSVTGKMTAEVKFEIAVMNMNNGDLEMAKALLEDIQANPFNNEYYTACVYLLATMDYKDKSLSEQKEIVDSAMDFANLYLDILIAKHKKVEELQNLKMQLFDAESKEEKLDLITKIQSAEDKISLASEKMLTTASGADEEKLRELWTMENDYIDSVNSIVEEVLHLHVLGEQPNDSRVSMVDDVILYTDQLYVLALAKRFLLDMETVSQNDLNIALSVASEIYESKKMIQMWGNVKDLIRTKDNQAKIESIDQYILDLHKSIANLENEMELRYSDYWINKETANELETELNSLLEDRQDLLEIRKFVAESFNERLAAILLRRTEKDAVKQDVVIDDHTAVVANIRSDINRVKSEFDYTIIDLLYIDTVKQDDAFIKARDNSSNSSPGGK